MEVYKLSKRQIDIMLNIDKYRENYNYGPFGCGKTFAATRGLGLYCYSHKPSKLGFALVSKTLKNIKRDMCKELSEQFGDNFRYNGSENTANSAMLYGHLINFVGCSDRSALSTIRGLSVRGILHDEMTTLESRVYFDELQGRLRGDLPDGENFFYVGLTNPDSKEHWFYKDIIKPAESGLTPNVHVERWSQDDILYPRAIEYYDSLKIRYANSPCYYARYIDGEWASADGLVYAGFNYKSHVIKREDISEADIAYYKIGVDFGISNTTAILVLAHSKYGEDIVVDEACVNDKVVSEISHIIHRLCLVYRPRWIFYDPSAAVLYVQLVQDGISNILKSNNDVLDGIMRVNDKLNTEGLFICENCTNTIREFTSYQWEDGKVDSVKKVNDHCMDALRYAVYTPFIMGVE